MTFLRQCQKSADSPDAFRDRDVAARLACSFNDLFVSKFQDIIRCLPCCVLRIGVSGDLLDLGGKVRHV